MENDGGYSIRTVCEEIWRIEEKYDLFTVKIADVKFWQLMRMILYYQITNQLGLFGTAQTSRFSLKDKLLAIPEYLFNSLTKNPFRGGEKDVLIFDHPRKVLEEGRYIDIYTDSLLNNYSVEECDVFENDYLRKHVTNSKQKNRRYLDWFYIRSLTWRFQKLSFTPDELAFISKLEKEINATFNIQIRLMELVYIVLKGFKMRFYFYDKLIQKKKPKLIYMVVSYGNEPLTAAAKRNHVKTIEIQHGVITKYHLGYSYPGKNTKLDYFPDELYCFGDYWKNKVPYPIDKKNIVSYGFPFLKRKVETYKKIPKKEKQILFISQGTIGEELSKIMYKLALDMPEYEFIYKLHPGEYDRWRMEYKDLLKAEQLPNVTVVDNNKKDLHQYFAESEFQVGVNSTAIFEGLAFHCKTILIDLPGIEYMEDLIMDHYAYPVKSQDGFKKTINQLTMSKFAANEFFAGIMG